METEEPFNGKGLYNPENEHDNCGIGFVVQMNGKQSNDIVKRGLQVLENMQHRGAKGADNETGDGAGILIHIPHKFFLKKNINLPEKDKYATGIIFLPKSDDSQLCLNIFQQFIEKEKLNLIGYRDIPVNNSIIGHVAKESEPFMKQVFIDGNVGQDVFERKLYLIRKQTEKTIRESQIAKKEQFYIVSLSTKIIIYKGMLSPSQLRKYFIDLQDPILESSIAMVHSRFSTNTFPAWKLAQPFRMIAHNGEINTIQGNRLLLHAREGIMQTEFFEDDLQKLFPIIEPSMSDSGSLDNAVEFFNLTGRSLPHVLSMLIPEPWNAKNPIPESLKSFYEYHSILMEPWDGPASIIFTDGRYIGGILDRNGLRPSRYVVTKDDLLVMGSEVGTQSFDAKNIRKKGILKPGKILLIDTKFNIIIPDSEIKHQLYQQNPYENWLKANLSILNNVNDSNSGSDYLGEKHNLFLKIFNYTKEDIEMIIKPMVEHGKEPINSMGNDAPMAILSKNPQRFFNYFRQRFAQVTNPSIDPLREDLVMSLNTHIGAIQKNILKESLLHTKLIKLCSPILSNADLRKIRKLMKTEFSHDTISTTFPINSGKEGMHNALENIIKLAENAVDKQKNFIILSDKNVSSDLIPIPILLVVSAINHHLIQKKKRLQIGIIVETADVREVNHFAQLIAFGANCINPYLVFSVINRLVEYNVVRLNQEKAKNNYIKAINNGLLKIMSKMGISTINSYFCSQNFEAIGLSSSVINKYFKGLSSPIEGLDINDIAKEVLENHKKAHLINTFDNGDLQSEGIYNFRNYGEKHAWNPESISLLQWACTTNNYDKYKEYAKNVNENTRQPHFLRGMFDLSQNPIPIEEVEEVDKIVKRFVTGAMSYGSISKEAHETLAIAMNTIGGRSNTGEGGEDPQRFQNNTRSAIKQVASGRFGVNTHYLVNADEIQIKIAQGAKPGEGGQLPGYKVNKIIAKVRNSTPGITLISPPPHHDIYSIEDLAQLIYDLKSVNPDAKISVKLVSGHSVGTIAAGVAKAKADLIIISGTEGGTGASPQSSIKYAGTSWELGLSETQQTLVINNLRGRVRLQIDGQIKTGLDVVYAALLGADEFGISTAALVVLGCVMVRKCHLNICPTGIATQNKILRRKFKGKAEWVINYFRFIANEIREIMAQMGFREFNDIIGKANLLKQRTDFNHWKINTIDLSKIKYLPPEVKKYPLYNVELNNKHKTQTLDHDLIKLSQEALDKRHKVWIAKNIYNTNRAVGATLSGEVVKRSGNNMLSKNTINCKFTGSAGQSFAAFLVHGVSFRLVGDANDYLGKGLSGGKIVVVPPNNSGFKPEDNLIVGNTCLYGATAGFVYIRGIAGQRFCVRNSGAHVVVEGVGDHGCEYMTGGRVVVLGKTGRNFAAGMSGGIAYVLDIDGNFDFYCNKKMVSLEKLDNFSEIKELQFLINKHLLHTNSSVASNILTNWNKYFHKFTKVIPFEYKKVLEDEKLRRLKLQLKQTKEEIYHY